MSGLKPVIERTVEAGRPPATVASLRHDLLALGVRPGELLITHTSLSALGFVIGGARAVIAALLDALGPDGTLVMPAFSADLGDPAPWENPPVPEAWWPLFREHMPAFDKATTPVVAIGVVAELFRRWPGVLRSDHPSCSFAAHGPLAEAITADHALAFSFGETSPLARLYERDARVLLLGVRHGSDSSLHLAEHRADIGIAPRREAAPLLVDGERRWTPYDDIDCDGDDFEALGEDFARETDAETVGQIALATARLFSQRAVVDYAVGWLERHRPRGGSARRSVKRS